MEAYDDINSGIEKMDLYLKGLFEGKKNIRDLQQIKQQNSPSNK